MKGSLTLTFRILDLNMVGALIDALVDGDIPDDARVERALEILADAKPHLVEDEAVSFEVAREALAAIRRANRTRG